MEATATKTASEHLGLVMFIANKAAERWGGERDEWVGSCYVWVDAACKRYDGSRGSKFSPYVVQFVLWKLLDEHRKMHPRNRTFCYLDPGRASRDSGEVRRCDARMDADAALWAMTENEAHVAALRATGVQWQDIAAVLGRSKQRAAQIGQAAYDKARGL